MSCFCSLCFIHCLRPSLAGRMEFVSSCLAAAHLPKQVFTGKQITLSWPDPHFNFQGSLSSAICRHMRSISSNPCHLARLQRIRTIQLLSSERLSGAHHFTIVIIIEASAREINILYDPRESFRLLDI